MSWSAASRAAFSADLGGVVGREGLPGVLQVGDDAATSAFSWLPGVPSATAFS